MLENTAEGAAQRNKGHKNAARVIEARRQEVTDEMTSQQSVQYGKAKVEMRCGQWHLHLNCWTGAGSWCDLKKSPYVTPSS